MASAGNDSDVCAVAQGYIRIAKALEPARLDWLELDIHDPEALRQIRDAAPMPIASLESLCKPANKKDPDRSPQLA